MAAEYLPLFVLLLVSTLFAGAALGVPALFGPRKPDKVKLSTYECGRLPFGDALRPIPVLYYRVALLFLLFDVEVIFLYPWALLLRELRWFALIEAGVFVLILVVGLVYAWRYRAWDWE